MNKDQFWELIESARVKARGDLDEMYGFLKKLLSELAIPDIMTFQQIFMEYQNLSYKEKLWAAAYVINGGCSDDGFDYFRGWLTAQGKTVFMAALADPDSLADYDEAREDETEFEDMLGVAADTYFKKLNMNNRDYDLFSSELDEYPLLKETESEIRKEIRYAKDIDEEWDEDELLAILPKLCAKFEWE